MQWKSAIRQAAKDCAFAGDMNNQIRDAVVGKCSSAYVRRKLLEEGPNLTLDRAMEIAALCERIEEQMSASSVSDTSKADMESVNRVWKKGGKQTKVKFQGKQQAESSKMHKHCYRCVNTDHMGRDLKCPARGQMSQM